MSSAMLGSAGGEIVSNCTESFVGRPKSLHKGLGFVSSIVLHIYLKSFLKEAATSHHERSPECGSARGFVAIKQDVNTDNILEAVTMATL